MSVKGGRLIELAKENSLKAKILYTYDISKLPNSNKVRFVYLLKGRNKQKGLVADLGGRFLVPGSFILPFDKYQQIQDVFTKWNVTFENKVVVTDE